jgi:hypothetical protein
LGARVYPEIRDPGRVRLVGGVARGRQAALQEEMVPSDLLASLFPDRHARSERGIWKRRDVNPLLPDASFGQLRIKAPMQVRRSASSRSPFFDAAFHSLAAKAGLSAGPRSQVNVPGLHLQNDHGNPHLARSVSRSCPRPAFSCLARSFTA